jgi:hypothetical protein
MGRLGWKPPKACLLNPQRQPSAISEVVLPVREANSRPFRCSCTGRSLRQLRPTISSRALKSWISVHDNNYNVRTASGTAMENSL